MIKHILVNRHHVNHNVRDPSKPALPVISLKTEGKSHYGFSLDIDGPSTMVYRPTKPLSCGATVWIVTRSPVTLYETMEDVVGKKFY